MNQGRQVALVGETGLTGDVCNGRLRPLQQLFRFLDASCQQILMRSLSGRLSKQHRKMRRADLGDIGELSQRERVTQVGVDKLNHARKPLL